MLVSRSEVPGENQNAAAPTHMSGPGVDGPDWRATRTDSVREARAADGLPSHHTAQRATKAAGDPDEKGGPAAELRRCTSLPAGQQYHNYTVPKCQ